MRDAPAEKNLERILADFHKEIDYLLSEGVLTGVDKKKLMGQAEISRNAMFKAKKEYNFDQRTENKLLNALLDDFERSLQRILDKAISRKGDRGLLIHRLYISDNYIRTKSAKMNISTSELEQLQNGMDLLKTYALRSLPKKKSRWGQSSIDVEALAKDYEDAVLDYLRNGSPRTDFLS